MDPVIYVAYLVTFAVPATWWARRRMRYERVRWTVIEVTESFAAAIETRRQQLPLELQRGRKP